MAMLSRRRSEKRGLPPGTVVHVGEKKVEKVRITIIDYDESQYQEKEVESIEECFPYKEKPTVTWINIDGLHQVDLIEHLGECFGIHPLVLEDIVHTGQRPKMEDYDNHLFIVLRMPGYNQEEDEVEDEQVSLILGDNLVVSFQERVGDVFEPVRGRLRRSKGKMRKSGADYLAYALVDTLVDSYFGLLERIGEHVEGLEEELVSDPTTDTLRSIQHLKRGLILLRRSLWPLREAVNGILRADSRLFQQDTLTYVRDVHDHSVQVIETIETFREMVSGMHDTYLSSLSNRMNDVMRVLTIIATIFIPVTFIAGIYGMNFDYMPELKWRWGYLTVIAIMVVTVVAMIVNFKKKRWF